MHIWDTDTHDIFEEKDLKFIIKTCQVGWSCRIHQMLLCRGVTHQRVSWYDTKLSDGEVLVMLELWRMQTTPILLSLPGPLWPEVVAPDRVIWTKRCWLRCDCFCIQTAYLCLNELFKIELFWHLTASSSSSCRTTSTDIPDPLSPPLPIVHLLWLVFRATSRILTKLLYSRWSSCICTAICGGP